MTTQAIPSISGIAAALHGGAATVQALHAPFEQRAAALNPRFRAFSHLFPRDDSALEALEREARGGKLRPLHGVAASVKGNLPVSGAPWTEGTRMHAGRKATSDAAVVARLRQAGALMLGSTTLSELAMYGTTNPFEPMGLNPWDPARTAGGSSTGAGVAASLGMALVNVGTDSGGSIRNPACHCGAVGFMPRIGAISNDGSNNYTPTLTSTGLIGRSVADVVAAYRALAEHPGPRAEASRRLLVPTRLIEEMCDDATRSLFDAALKRAEKAGFTLLPCNLAEWMPGEAAAGTISLYESGLALRTMNRELASAGIQDRYKRASQLTDADVRTARLNAASFRNAVSRALTEASADAFASPCWPFAAPGIDAQVVDVRGRSVPVDPHRNCFVRAANAIDATAVTIPMGLYPEVRVPAGLHLMASGGSEERLLDAARLLEAVLPAIPPAPPLDR